MSKDKKRIPTDGTSGAEPDPPADNPFAALAALRDDLPGDAAPHAPGAAPRPFRVPRTRKGGFPVRLERRPGGGVVTVVEGVEGDSEELLALLKRRCGAGGCVRGANIELQGDHREQVTAQLQESGC